MQTNPSNDYYKKHSSHASSQPVHQPTLRQQQQQSQHHAHHQDTHSQHGLQHQHHLPVSAASQLLQSADYASQLLASNYGPAGGGGGGGGGGSGGGGTATSSMRSNLITVQIHDSNAAAAIGGLDASGLGPPGLPMPPNFTHQNFAPQFSPQNTSNAMTPFPVPPPSLGPIPPSLTQFFSTNSPGYVTPPPSQQRNANAPFNSNPQTSPMMAPTMMNPVAMVQQSRRPQFAPSVEQVMQPFPVPPPPHWHPTPNQTHFF